MDSSKEILSQELFDIEVKAYFSSTLLQAIFREDIPCERQIDVLRQGPVFQSLKQRVDELCSAKEAALEDAFLSVKSSIFETWKWIEVFAEYSKKHVKPTHPEKAIRNTKEALSFLDGLVKKADAFLPQVQQLRTRRLSTDFRSSLASFQAYLDQTLFVDPEPFSQEHLPFTIPPKEEIYKKSLYLLQKAAEFVQAHRNEWDRKLLAYPRNLYIHAPKEFPFAILYTQEGSIYPVLELVDHILGWGGGKHVSRTFELQSGKTWALIRPWPSQSSQEVKFVKTWRETQFLKKLSGVREIIDLKEAMLFFLGGKLNLFEICEFFPSISLEELLKKEKQKIPDKEKKIIAHDLLKALYHVHKAGIIHCDIKHQNVLVSHFSDQVSARAKLIDFNNACFLEETYEKTTLSFSFPAAPPECARILLEHKFVPTKEIIPFITPKMDIWCLGCLFFLLFFERELPWFLEDKTEASTLSNLLNKIAHLKEDWIEPSYQNHPFYPLIKRLLSIEAEKRPSIEEALEHFEKLSR